MIDEKIEQTIAELTNSVGKYNSFSNKNPTTYTSSNFMQNMKLPFSLNLIYVCISIFFISLISLIFLKPYFVMKDVKNEETFFIEKTVNYKFIVIISIITTLVLSYLLNIANKKWNLFS